MKYQQFKVKKDIDLRLLLLLDILKHEHKIIELDLGPDYDLTEYDKFELKNYYFSNFWNFGNEYLAIINFEVNQTRVFHYDDITQLSAQYGVEYNNDGSWDIFLNKVRKIYPDVLWNEGFEPDFDYFKLGAVKKEPVDQFRKRIKIYGGFHGGSHSIFPMDWSVFAECSFYGFQSVEQSGKFYVELIAESYALKDVSNFKLAYFIAFTALENYIKTHPSLNENTGRLNEKLSEVFSSMFDDIKSHQIYSSLIGEFKKLESLRNKIAHGEKDSIISIKDVNKLIIFILTLISSLERKIETFDELYNQLPTIKRY